MALDEVIERLTSPSLSVRTTATYELTYKDFWDSEITKAVRANLDADHADLVEITIMRLLVRGKDVESVQRVRSLLMTSRDDLVVGAALGALTNLARDFPETAFDTLKALEALPRLCVPPDWLANLEESIGELRNLIS